MKNPVTIEHVRKAVEWAAMAKDETPIDGVSRKYNQGTWDCGTSCCVWGAACLIAGNGPAISGPPDDWAKDGKEKILVALMNSGYSTPEQMRLILDRNLTRANLTRANLTRADLTGADLTGANLTGANLTRANLTRANLTRANLTRADLTGANLTGANLTRANLTRANLTRADLTRANLTRADLTGANLTRADLTGAKILLGNRIVKIA